MANQKFKKIISQIIKLAKEVYGELGSGFDERVYQKALEVANCGFIQLYFLKTKVRKLIKE